MKKIISVFSLIAILAVCLLGFSGCEFGPNKGKEDAAGANEEKSVNFMDDNKSYYFMYGGKKFVAGDPIKNVESVGLKLRDSEKTESVKANTYMIGAGYIQNAESKSVFHITPYNDSKEKVLIPETKIGGFNLDGDNLKNDPKLADVEVYGGIKIGSSEEDVKKVYGEPSSKYESTTWTTYTYKSSEVYRSFEFRIKDGKVIYLQWQNLVYND
ncbi:MAG: hypothetical protein IKE01_02010 [Clostridia bacterium]|nr:hypothetical protein [Clostridia bacterium]